MKTRRVALSRIESILDQDVQSWFFRVYTKCNILKPSIAHLFEYAMKIVNFSHILSILDLNFGIDSRAKDFSLMSKTRDLKIKLD
jgi:hypothetical protein